MLCLGLNLLVFSCPCYVLREERGVILEILNLPLPGDLDDHKFPRPDAHRSFFPLLNSEDS